MGRIERDNFQHAGWGAAVTLPWLFAAPDWMPFAWCVPLLVFGILRERWQGKGQPPWEFSPSRWVEALGWSAGGLVVALVGLAF